MTNATVLLLSGYVLQWVVQRIFKDVAAIPLYNLTNLTVLPYCFAFYEI